MFTSLVANGDDCACPGRLLKQWRDCCKVRTRNKHGKQKVARGDKIQPVMSLPISLSTFIFIIGLHIALSRHVTMSKSDDKKELDVNFQD